MPVAPVAVGGSVVAAGPVPGPGPAPLARAMAPSAGPGGIGGGRVARSVAAVGAAVAPAAAPGGFGFGVPVDGAQQVMDELANVLDVLRMDLAKFSSRATSKGSKK